MLRTKVIELERRQRELEESHDELKEDCVTHRYLDAVISPMQHMMEEIQRDIKKLLMLVRKEDE